MTLAPFDRAAGSSSSLASDASELPNALYSNLAPPGLTIPATPHAAFHGPGGATPAGSPSAAAGAATAAAAGSTSTVSSGAGVNGLLAAHPWQIGWKIMCRMHDQLWRMDTTHRAQGLQTLMPLFLCTALSI